jgi:hypothetical protein
MADPRTHAELGTFIDWVKVLSDEPVAEGTVYRERSGPGFMKSESEWTITTFDPPRTLVHTSGDKSMPVTAEWTFTHLGPTSTRVTQALDFEMLPRFRPLGRLLEAVFARRMTERETGRMLQDLKRRCEAPGAA